MLLIDGRALAPRNPDADPNFRATWTEVFTYQAAQLFPREPLDQQHVAWTNHERLAWLRRLAHQDVWTEITVITTAEMFNFWRLLPPEITVQTIDGQRLTTAKRTVDPMNWAQAFVIGDHRRGAMKKITPQQQKKAVQLVAALSVTEPIAGIDLLPHRGTYTAVDITTFPDIRQEIIRHILSGGRFGWDTETEQAGEDDDAAPNPIDTELVGLSVSIAPGTGWYFPVGHRNRTTDEPQPWNLPRQLVIDLVGEIWDAQTRIGAGRSTGSNLKYDYGVMTNPRQRLPFDMVAQVLPRTDDTMLMAQVANLPRAGLKPLAETILGMQVIDYKKLTRGRSFAYVPLEPATVYAAQDADWPLQLYDTLLNALQELEVEHIYREEVTRMEYFLRMERRGVLVDRQRLEEHIVETKEAIDFTERLFKTMIQVEGIALPNGFNIGSTDQVAAVFFAPKPAGLGMPVLTRTSTGKPSTSEPAMNDLIAKGLAHPAVKVKIAWAGHNKLLTAFLNPIRSMIRSDGRIHANFRQCPAATGRTACHDPNIQQVEKHLKDMFVTEGEIAGLDYSQVELRVLAADFHEPKMLETFNLPRFLLDPETGELLRDEKGNRIENPDADIHGRTQREVGLPNRTKAKNFNFGKAFGAGAPTLSRTAAMPMHVVEAFIKRFDDAYSDYYMNLKRLQHKLLLEAEADGQCVIRNWHGRARVMPRPRHKGEINDLLRIISNTPVQGGAADIAKWAMDELLPLLRAAEHHGIYPINFIHDEFDFECSPETPPEVWRQFLADAEAVMVRCNPFADRVPLAVDVERGTNWADLRVIDVPDEPDMIDVARTYAVA